MDPPGQGPDTGPPPDPPIQPGMVVVVLAPHMLSRSWYQYRYLRTRLVDPAPTLELQAALPPHQLATLQVACPSYLRTRPQKRHTAAPSRCFPYPVVHTPAHRL